jgi:HlyD family secretion protein
MAHEGDFVKVGQPLAEMQVDSLQAQLDEARARHQEAMQSMSTAVAQVAARQGDKAASVAQLAQRESDLGAAEASVSQREADLAARLAVVTEREAELNAAQSHFARSSTLVDEGASSRQELDDDRAKVAAATAAVASAKAQSAAAEAAVRTAKGQVETARAAVTAAKAQISAAQATVEAANAQVGGAGKNVEAAKATIARIEVDYKDATLTSPRNGRVQYRVSQPGEVLPAGGKVLNLVDLGDVYMTFFVPESAAGKISMGSEARVVLDAAPQWVIPAWISYVSSVAQFTPKTVETAAERQKLTFRVKAQIDRNLLKRQLRDIKTGLPGVAWVKLDPDAKWPPELEVKVPPESSAAPNLEPPN